MIQRHKSKLSLLLQAFRRKEVWDNIPVLELGFEIH